MTRLVIARHGNTFESGQTPRRVGARTDLPLTETGRAQGRAVGLLLRAQGMIPARVYTGSLRRTVETAREAMDAAG
ncbi:MAG TPA: phosphoglycerate mutase family protein, partial [Alphaproteobacteria bacterium]|nr:phosphoglycerate mutase family protein [Alphaproteobacteria bacterium]